MGRPKVYADDAEKMKAYRARRAGEFVTVHKRTYEQMQADTRALRAAVVKAAGAGDALAASLPTATGEDVLLALIAHFEGVKPVAAVAPVVVAVPRSSPAVVVRPVGGQLSRSERRKLK